MHRRSVHESGSRARSTSSDVDGRTRVEQHDLTMHLPRRTILAAATLFAFAGCGGFGDLPFPVVPVCQGVPAEKCLEFARNGARDLGLGGAVITRIVVRCAAQCTATKGEGSTEVTIADGTTQITGWAYESIGG